MALSVHRLAETFGGAMSGEHPRLMRRVGVDLPAGLRVPV